MKGWWCVTCMSLPYMGWFGVDQYITKIFPIWIRLTPFLHNVSKPLHFFSNTFINTKIVLYHSCNLYLINFLEHFIKTSTFFQEYQLRIISHPLLLFLPSSFASFILLTSVLLLYFARLESDFIWFHISEAGLLLENIVVFWLI